MFNTRELATLLAALQFWREEITPHGPEIAEPYLVAIGMPGVAPLRPAEIERLARRLRTLHNQQPD